MNFLSILITSFILLISTQVFADETMIGGGIYKSKLEAERGCAATLRSYYVQNRNALIRRSGPSHNNQYSDVIEGYKCGWPSVPIDSDCPILPGLVAMYDTTYRYPFPDDTSEPINTEAVG